jgi:hypothetical protein
MSIPFLSVRPLAGSFVLLAALGVLGCGGSQGSVKGKVMFQGKPLTGGVVVLVGSDGKVSSPGDIQPDGSYCIARAPLGKVKVTVDNPPPPNYTWGEVPEVPEAQAKDAEVQAGLARAKSYVAIPLTYKDPQQTPLSLEVQGGENYHDINLN